MGLKVLTGTLKKNLIVNYRAYPISFFVGNTLTCPTGPTGPTGPANLLSGLQVQLQGSSGGTVANNINVL